MNIGFVRIIFVVSAFESGLREAFSFRSHFSSKDADNLSEIFQSLNNFAKDARKFPREIFVHLFDRPNRYNFQPLNHFIKLHEKFPENFWCIISVVQYAQYFSHFCTYKISRFFRTSFRSSIFSLVHTHTSHTIRYEL